MLLKKVKQGGAGAESTLTLKSAVSRKKRTFSGYA